ncbi:MAG: hypothetical protein LBH28_01280, partial [Oscillospiraceae bacterium]|nr:hypothetical protein [Oscillospiraceae bacterium]
SKADVQSRHTILSCLKTVSNLAVITVYSVRLMMYNSGVVDVQFQRPGVSNPTDIFIFVIGLHSAIPPFVLTTFIIRSSSKTCGMDIGLFASR